MTYECKIKVNSNFKLVVVNKIQVRVLTVCAIKYKIKFCSVFVNNDLQSVGNIDGSPI